MHIPGATYRIQFNHLFGFQAALAVVPYLSDLGITDLYASPIFRAVPGSMHGYDVTDPNTINPEIGTEEEFRLLSEELERRGMYWIQDIVPNHMAYSSGNRLLMDLLENGTMSRFAGFFDVEWNHPHASARQRILAPFLGTYYWNAVTDGTIRLGYGEDGFFIQFYDEKYPLRVESYYDVLNFRLDRLRNRLGRNNPDMVKYLGILYVIRSLSEDITPEEWAEQTRFIKDLVRELYQGNDEIKEFVDESVKIFNAEREITENHDLLDRLLGEQHYRLAFWKVANEEINYRRFFNISSLIGVRMENEDAFNRMHSFLLKLVKEGRIHGLRIDHVDGLFDPKAYLERLRERTKLYIAVEKILEATEQLPEDWPVEGTTGYEFGYKAAGIFTRQESSDRFGEIYTSFTRLDENFEELVHEKKALIIHTRMAGEVERLAFLMEAVSSSDRHGIDITMLGLKQALEAILTHFPVYRTYVNSENISAQDRAVFDAALREAGRANPRLENELGYIANILTGLHEEPDGELKARFLEFIMRLQQLTGPVMAKGFEDTALYIYNRLISLNEVGGNPGTFGVNAEEFHEWNRSRGGRWPHAMNTTYTHDTKRGEDVRARISVLSEIPEDWAAFLQAMSEAAAGFRTKRGRYFMPDRNDEYFLYQSILGSHPFYDHELPGWIERLKAVAEKSVREASVHTAWIRPDEEYEAAVRSFIEAVLDPENSAVRKILRPIREKVAFFGIWNSLSQLLLKATVPGVPDFYQGSEVWDFSLVDPDNRRPVDFPLRLRFLEEIRGFAEAGGDGQIGPLFRDMKDGRIKLFLMYRALQARRSFQYVFQNGGYAPLAASGTFGQNIVAFSRTSGTATVAVAAPRFLTSLVKTGEIPTGREVWKNTRVDLPGTVRRWKNLITGESVSGGGPVNAGELFRIFPGAILAGE